MALAASEYDAVVVGAGPTGLLCGLALARAGLATAVCGQLPTPGRGDEARTAALFRTSIAVLEQYGGWPALKPAAEPLRAIRIVDELWQGLRAPEVTFDATSIGESELGWNIPNNLIVQALAEAASSQSRCTLFLDTTIMAIEPGHDVVSVSLSTGNILSARLVVGADGRKSIARESAGIELKAWEYNQTAIGTNFAHSRDHRGISTEFHRNGGPLTVVPMKNRRSSLVWVERCAEAERLLGLPDTEFVTALEERLQGLLGSISDLRPRASFPLTGSIASSFAANRIALIGEAAHAFPPIGAQGLNLGIRDVDGLARCVAEALNNGHDIGSEAVLAAYNRVRGPDVAARSIGVDMLSKSLTSTIFPVRLARGAFLHAANALPVMKRLLIEAGMAAPGPVGHGQRPP